MTVKLQTVITCTEGASDIKIDRKIDAFLAKTFSRYDYYCSERVDMDEQNYVYYTGINEDSQADDLTLLAVKKL